MLPLQLAKDKGRESADSENGEHGNEMRAEPVVFLSFVEHDLKRAHANDEQADAPIVDDVGGAADIRRIEDEPLRHESREQADRQVDVKDPTPAVTICNPTT